MSKLITIGSGSSGNAYVLKCDKESLLLELGVSWEDIKLALGFDLSSISGAIVSHGHGDHSKSIKDAIKAGIEVYSTEEVQSLYPKVKVPKMGLKTQIGGFLVQPLLVPHSCECYAYIITHEEFGKLVFATDCSAFKYKIKDVNHWLIESNWSEDAVIDNACEDNFARSLYQHHMEINETINALRVNFGASTNSITLCHLSSSNSNERKFVKMVKEELGFDNVFVAEYASFTSLEKEDF